MIKFPDIYTTCIYNYIQMHDGDLILYRDIMDKYKMSYPTVRRRMKWLVENNYVIKEGRRLSLTNPFDVD